MTSAKAKGTCALPDPLVVRAMARPPAAPSATNSFTGAKKLDHQKAPSRRKAWIQGEGAVSGSGPPR